MGHYLEYLIHCGKGKVINFLLIIHWLWLVTWFHSTTAGQGALLHGLDSQKHFVDVSDLNFTYIQKFTDVGGCGDESVQFIQITLQDPVEASNTTAIPSRLNSRPLPLPKHLSKAGRQRPATSIQRDRASVFRSRHVRMTHAVAREEGRAWKERWMDWSIKSGSWVNLVWPFQFNSVIGKHLGFLEAFVVV